MCSSENRVVGLDERSDNVQPVSGILTDRKDVVNYAYHFDGDGFILQVLSANQWSSPVYQSRIARFSTPGAVCGYASTATALMLAQEFPYLRMTRAQVMEMIELSRSQKALENFVEWAMSAIQHWRSEWILASQYLPPSSSSSSSPSSSSPSSSSPSSSSPSSSSPSSSSPSSSSASPVSHSGDRPPKVWTERAKQKYMTDWVANYEISDMIRSYPTASEAVHFVRHLERSNDVDEEEEVRVEEERDFRDLTVFIEQRVDSADTERSREYLGVKRPLRENSRLLSPSAWQETNPQFDASQAAATDSPAPVFVCDGLGHFVCVRPVILVDEDDPTAATRLLLVFNSLESNYTLVRAVALIYRMVFLGKSEKNDPMFLATTRLQSFQ